jgi:proline iminopeptidase
MLCSLFGEAGVRFGESEARRRREPMPVAHINGTELFYLEVGEGLPCLVTHGGLGGDHSALHPWLDPLGDVLHLVYYDHRGNGRSGRPPAATITFEQLCADADALREHLGYEEIAVLGHSYGGFIALEYALRYPESLRRLILLGTSPAFDHGEEVEANARRKGATPEQLEALEATPQDDAEAWRQWKVLESLYFRDYDEQLAERVMGKTVVSNYAGDAGDAILEEWSLTPRLGEISAPTLILVGRDDFVCPPSRAQIMHEGIANSELVVFEKSGHFAYAEDPDAFFEAVRSWLQQT